MLYDASTKGLNTWKSLKPLTIEEILSSSNCKINLQDQYLEYKRIDGFKAYAIGFFRKGTKTRHGISRSVGKDGQIQEGMFDNDKLSGFARVCFKSGDYYIGQYQEGKKQGKGKYVFMNGNVLDGDWEDEKFVKKDGK